MGVVKPACPASLFGFLAQRCRGPAVFRPGENCPGHPWLLFVQGMSILGPQKKLKFYRWIWVPILHPLAMETSSGKKKFASSFHCHCGLDWWFFISCVMLGSAWRLCSIRKCSTGHWTSKDPYHEWGLHIMWCHCPHPLGEGVPQLGLIRWIHLLQRVCGAQRGATRPEAGFYQNVWWF